MKLFIIITVALPLLVVARPSGVFQSRGLIRRTPPNDKPGEGFWHEQLQPPPREPRSDDGANDDPRLKRLHQHYNERVETVKPSDTMLNHGQPGSSSQGDSSHHPTQQELGSNSPHDSPVPFGHTAVSARIAASQAAHIRAAHIRAAHIPAAHIPAAHIPAAHIPEAQIPPEYVDPEGKYWVPASREALLREIPLGFTENHIAEYGAAWWKHYLKKIQKLNRRKGEFFDENPGVGLTNNADEWNTAARLYNQASSGRQIRYLAVSAEVNKVLKDHKDRSGRSIQ